jgi:hypothetical protein
VVGGADGALVGRDVVGVLVELCVGFRVGLAVGPMVASQHVTGQLADISSAVLGSVHQPRLRKSWHGVPGSSSPAHEGAAGEVVGSEVVGDVDGEVVKTDRRSRPLITLGLTTPAIVAEIPNQAMMTKA